jgi:hypothetical protein
MIIKNKNTSTFGLLLLAAHSADGDTCPSNKDEVFPVLNPLEDYISTNPELPELSANLGKKEPLDKQILEPEEKEPLDKQILEPEEKEPLDKQIREPEELLRKKNKLNQFFLDIKILDFIKSVFLKEKNLSFLSFVTGVMVLVSFFLLVIFRILFKGS